MKKTSVLMSTYNGEVFIKEQLDSIRNQTRPVDEVIIQDDCSTDRTCYIVSEYIKTNHLENSWFLFENNNNLGWKKNFVSGLKHVSGDYIFFCDQDDVWTNNKVERITEIMNNNHDIELLVSDYNIVYSDSTRSYVEKNKRNGKSDIYRYQAKRRFLYVMYPGCTYCFKKNLLDYYRQYWSDQIPHDAFVWHITNMRKSLFVLNEELIQYRRHKNTVTGRKISSREERLSELDYYEKIINLYKNEKISICDNIKYINQAERWIKNRREGLTRNCRRSIWNNIFLIRFYWSVKTFLVDLYITYCE